MTEQPESKSIYCGRQNCSDLHFWGPGLRTCNIIHYVIRGSGFFVCRGKVYPVSAGQSFLIRPFTEVYYYPDKNNPWEYTWIEFADEKFLRLLNKITFCGGSCIIGFIEPEKILPFYDYLSNIYSCADRRNTAESTALAILSVYADSYPVAGCKTRDDMYFDSACIIIQSHYHRPEFGVDSVCRKLNISRATLHRSFKKKCGVSPGAYLTRYRMERAKELLQCGASVKATALSCGFADPLYFSKAFCKLQGMPPREYRLPPK